MTDTKAGRVVILGVGNLLLGDEGVGVHVARRLAQVELPEGVEVIEAGTMPTEALGPVGDIARLVIVDAVAADGPPGAVYRLPVSVAANTDAELSLHEFTLAEALAEWRLRGLEADRIVIIGVQPHKVEWSTELSPQVEANLPKIVDTAIAEAIAERTRTDDSQ